MRVIALNSFLDTETNVFHSYGHEFDQPAGAKLDAWLKDGVVREDDRMKKTLEARAAEPAPAAEPSSQGEPTG
jgi:hypothetical protein